MAGLQASTAGLLPAYTAFSPYPKRFFSLYLFLMLRDLRQISENNPIYTADVILHHGRASATGYEIPQLSLQKCASHRMGSNTTPGKIAAVVTPRWHTGRRGFLSASRAMADKDLRRKDSSSSISFGVHLW